MIGWSDRYHKLRMVKGSGAGDTGLTSKLANIICSEDFDSKLESLMEELPDLTATFANDRTILHHLAMTKPLLKGSEYRGGNVAKCVYEFAKRGVDLDMQDIAGNTALHYAAMLEDQLCSDALIRQGADLCMKNVNGESAIGDILMYLPNSFSALEEKLDKGINVKGDYSKDEVENTSFYKTVTLDFKVLLSKIYDHPSDGNILSEILKEVEKNQGIYNTERKHLERVFLHPLTWCFLNYKWHQVRVQYWIQLVCHVIFSLTYSSYVHTVYSEICDPLWLPSSSFNGSNWKDESWIADINCPLELKDKGKVKTHWLFHTAPMLTVLWVTLLCFIAMYTVKELVLFAYLRLGYFSKWENFLSMLLLVVTYSFIVLHPAPGMTIKIKYYHYHVAAIGVLLTWILNMLYVAQSPTYGSYVHMMVKLSINFVQLFFAISSLLIAFATSFSILFPREASMKNLYTSPLKMLSIMAGEIEYNDLIYPKQWSHENGKVDTDERPPIFPHTTLILLNAFILIFPIIIMNLFFGIAVNEVDGIIKIGLVRQNMKMVTIIQLYEKALWAMLNVTPRCLHKLIKPRPLYRKESENVYEVDMGSHGKKILPRKLEHEIMLAIERRQGKGYRLPTLLHLMKMIERLEHKLDEKK